MSRKNLPALEGTRAGMRWYVDFGLANPHQYRLVFGQPPPQKVEEDCVLNQQGLQALEYLARCIARCRAEGLFIPGDDMADSIAAWAQLHGLTMVSDQRPRQVRFPVAVTRRTDRSRYRTDSAWLNRLV